MYHSNGQEYLERRKNYFEELARPKQAPPEFIEDRRSVYWVDKLPPQPPTVFALSPRLEKLVKSKKYHPGFKPDLPTPIRTVPRSALNYPEKERLKQLARPKNHHVEFKPDRSVQTLVSAAAQQNVPSERLARLSAPKQYDELFIKPDSSWEWGDWSSDVPPEALKHIASSREEQLAEPKRGNRLYESNRSVIWEVSEGAKTAQPSTRQQQLARPKTRIALDQDYDPYKVSFAAKNAVASPRVDELANPIPRKQRSKKVL